ncbi:protein of unknown function [Methylocaldum szegediense]|uniref:Transposase DDE domain-containing protein n=1 Tax=Methylocaldum szegediense TaxID=73780 RepID=A0ABN8WWH8_9GAMM|nr:protein of unknown function [Methylocaldum szegediense]
MHVNRLDGDQRRKRGGVFQDQLAHQPRVGQRIVGVHQNTATSDALAPARYLHDALPVGLRITGGGLRTGRKNIYRIETDASFSIEISRCAGTLKLRHKAFLGLVVSDRWLKSARYARGGYSCYRPGNQIDRITRFLDSVSMNLGKSIRIVAQAAYSYKRLTVRFAHSYVYLCSGT